MNQVRGWAHVWHTDTVCMEQIIVDCGDDAGAEVVFSGSGESGASTAVKWAEKLGSIHYEAVGGTVRPRLTRMMRGRRPVALGPTGAQDRYGALNRPGLEGAL